MKRVLTVATVAAACAVMAFAGVTAQQSSARSTACHTFPPVVAKAKSTVKHGGTVTVTVSLGKSLDHGLSLSVQYRQPGSAAWRAYGAATLMAQSPVIVKWKAPKRTGMYKLRVKAEYGDETGSGVTYSSARAITVY
jgi:hypothetical protein